MVYGRPNALSSNPADTDPQVRPIVTPGIDSKSASTLTYGATSALRAVVMKPDAALLMKVENGFWLPILRACGVPTLVNVDGVGWVREKWGRTAKTIFATGGRATAQHPTTHANWALNGKISQVGQECSFRTAAILAPETTHSTASVGESTC
jgi:hypothetical protein